MQSLQDKHAEWDIYRHDVLGDMRNRYDDDDAHMSMDDLERDLERVAKLNPISVSYQQEVKATETPIVEASASISVPLALK